MRGREGLAVEALALYWIIALARSAYQGARSIRFICALGKGPKL
jgi:hypothetical protein